MRLKYIDVLKAFAIIAVVLYHSRVMEFGYLGVDVFLVINGYLITKSLYGRFIGDRIHQNGFVLKDYFIFIFNKIIRLLPVLLAACIISTIIGFFVMLPDDYENLSESVIATNIFANNILSAITTKNYWNIANIYKPLMHTWYVGLIMQFYLLYPFVFILARTDKRFTRKSLLFIISSLALVSLILYLSGSNEAHRFYYLPSRFFEFAFGGIVALVCPLKESATKYYKLFVFICYAVVLLLMSIEINFVPNKAKLVCVVILTSVLVASKDTLENTFISNHVLARIGEASYSVFVWHQVILAFYRYTVSSSFSVIELLCLLSATALVSWLSFRFIEQKTGIWIKQYRTVFYIVLSTLWLGSTCSAGLIYMNGGVVRDVPELYISTKDIHRGLHSDYNDRVFELIKPFETSKSHWLVIGNSFGRDFVNVILESPIVNEVEVSYIYYDQNTDLRQPSYLDRFSHSDRVFLSTLGVNEKIVSEIEDICMQAGIPLDHFNIVSEKNFGETNGQFYVHRKKKNYFDQRTSVRQEFLEKNTRLKSLYGNRYIDLLTLLIDEKGTVPVFTPDHYFISQDCEHFSKGGAVYFSSLIDWNKYLD